MRKTAIHTDNIVCAIYWCTIYMLNPPEVTQERYGPTSDDVLVAFLSFNPKKCKRHKSETLHTDKA